MIRAAAEPIAIIGLGLRFPGARGPDEFWRMLREGRSGISEVPAHRAELGFNIDEIYDPRPGTPGKISSKLGGFLADAADLRLRKAGWRPRRSAGAGDRCRPNRQCPQKR